MFKNVFHIINLVFFFFIIFIYFHFIDLINLLEIIFHLRLVALYNDTLKRNDIKLMCLQTKCVIEPLDTHSYSH